MKLKFYLTFFIFFILLGIMSFFLPHHRGLLIPYIILMVLVPFFMIRYFGHGNSRKLKKLSQKGIRSSAIVLSVEDLGFTMNKINIGLSLSMEVRPLTEDPFKASLDVFVSRVQIPRVGDKVEVIYDPSNHLEVALVV
ncbi:MAG: hypothetical protein IPJ69_14435 [Deltaproteobacteria bacterium]|nr:MAG: hypothetical protein IPJ69_14435 [Deltaproteobacteria bacterium]